MASINTEYLTFVDVSTDKVGDFLEDGNFSQNLHNFVASPVGEAQVKSLKEEMVAQMAAQGVENYEPTDNQIYRALFNEQNGQDAGYSHADVTNQKMLDDHGPAWYENLGGAISATFEKVHNFVQEEVNPLIGAGLKAGTDVVVDGVKSAPGTGDVVNAIENRQQQIEDATNGIQSGNDAAKNSMTLLKM